MNSIQLILLFIDNIIIALLRSTLTTVADGGSACRREMFPGEPETFRPSCS